MKYTQIVRRIQLVSGISIATTAAIVVVLIIAVSLTNCLLFDCKSTVFLLLFRVVAFGNKFLSIYYCVYPNWQQQIAKEKKKCAQISNLYYIHKSNNNLREKKKHTQHKNMDTNEHLETTKPKLYYMYKCCKKHKKSHEVREEKKKPLTHRDTQHPIYNGSNCDFVN